MNFIVILNCSDKKTVQQFKSIPFIRFLDECFDLSIAHIRTCLSGKHPRDTIIIVPFSTDILSQLHSIHNVIENRIIIVYLYGDFDKITHFIMENNGPFNNVLQKVDALITSQYRYSFKLEKLLKKKINDFLDHENYYQKKMKLFKLLYSVSRDSKYKNLLSSLTQHEIINYMDNIILIHGEKRIQYNIDEFIVVCLVKNGEIYIREFINHYTTLGAKHIFFLDNGSMDNTVSICKEYSHVSVYLTTLSFSYYENEIREAFIKDLCSHRWCLYADIDEFFDYPYSDKISMKDFLHYLTIHHYTAVLLQMLILYPGNKPEGFESREEYKKSFPFIEKCCYYNLRDIEDTDYGIHKENNNLQVSSETIKLHLKKRVDDHSLSIFKHSLFYVDDIINLFINPHFCQNAHIADITCLLKHYKISSTYYETEYPSDHMKFQTIDELIDMGFIVVSEQYRDYIQTITPVSNI